ncbi:polyprenyl synthetase family protein [Bacillus amyloliquefaciens]|uniref:polyprenyl synthetase family protein n=1 Tax=Bacillus amyloliquefaciens TaxID=1390 RepID=UPI003A8C5B44
MCLDAETIKGKMKEIVEHNIYNTNLKMYLLKFIASKDSFGFAELAYQHYTAFNGRDTEAILKLAVGLELLVLSYDIYDDLEDNDNLKMEWMKTGLPITLNTVTALYTLSIQVMNQVSENPYFLKQILNFALNSIEGQQDDILNAPQTEEECLEMIKNKSGSLTAMSCVMGAMLATGNLNPIVQSYSYELGIISQIDNDYQGLFYLNNDFVQRKNTLAYLYLKKRFNKASEEILQWYENPELFKTLKTRDIKKKLIEAGVTQYLLVLKHLSLKKIKSKIFELEIERNKSETLLNAIVNLEEDEK